MNGPLTRLKGTALRPLWTETEEYRARRRCRTLIATPFAALGGLTWGVFAAPVIGSGSQLLWGALGAFAFPLFMYLEQRTVPALRELARRLGLGRGAVAGLVWEAGVVGGLLYFATRVVGAPLVPAVGTALGVGAFYAFVMEYVLCGSAAADVVGLIRGGRAGARPRPPSLGPAEAALKRGDTERALALYREALAGGPTEGAAYLGLARALKVSGAPAEALETLRRGVVRASLSADQEAFFVRQIVEVCAGALGDPAEAEEDLRRLLERQPEGPHAAWARRELGE